MILRCEWRWTPPRVLMTCACSALIFFGDAHFANAKSGVETTGDILQFVLPGAAAGLTLANRDWEGALQFGESAGLTLGTTYLLKYTVDEKRPNGGDQSFPSGHTSISFSAAEYLRKRYGLEYGIPAYGLASFVRTAGWKPANTTRTT